MSAIKKNLDQILADISMLNKHTQQTTQLLAVSKTKPASDVEIAYLAGQRLFGENYVQEGVEKIAQLKHLTDIQWHFIGPLQSNKTRLVAENFAWMQSLEREKIAQRLNQHRPEHMQPLNVCIQVNISKESSKSGVTPEQVEPLAEAIQNLKRLKLRGLMAIPINSQDTQVVSQHFKQLETLYQKLKATHKGIDTLSMGMSGDMHEAIRQGSTMVRIGTAIFGPRTNRH